MTARSAIHAKPSVKPDAPGHEMTHVFDWNARSTKRFTINQGGSSSGKTFGILQVLLLLARERPEQTITVTAESLPALRVGAIRDFEKIISRPPFNFYIARSNKSSNTYKLHNGSIIEFKSFKDEEAAKHGKRDVLFINEASSVLFDVAKNLMLRSKRVFIDFNPNADFWVHDQYMTHPNAQWIFSTYRDNAFADADIIADIESLRDTDPELYKVYGLGKRGALKGQVFSNVIYVPELPSYLSDVVYCMDIGFTNSFTTLLKIGQADGKMWGKELIYEKGLIETDIVARLNELNIPKSAPLIVDSAAAMTIEFLRREGDFNAIACKKKDVVGEVAAMKRFVWCITDDSVNWKKEVKNYLYSKGTDGKPSNRPNKAFDHAWDAARYGFLYIQNPNDLPEFF